MGDGVGWFRGYALLLGGGEPGLDAFLRFRIQRLRNWSRATHATETKNYNMPRMIAATQCYQVAYLDFAGGFGVVPIEVYSAFVHFIGRQASGFIKPGSPEPFVQTDRVYGGFCDVGFRVHPGNNSN